MTNNVVLDIHLTRDSFQVYAERAKKVNEEKEKEEQRKEAAERLRLLEERNRPAMPR